MTKRSKDDWEAIERDFRLGRGTLREIGAKHGVTHQAILRRISKFGWEKDHTEEVRARTNERLLLAGPKADQEPKPDQKRTKREKKADQPKPSPTQITAEHIDAAAEEQVSIHLAHRKMAAGFRSLAETLLAEAKLTTDAIGEIQDTIEEETAGDRTANRRTMMMRAVSLPSRAATLSSLSASGRNIQYIERLSHNLAPALPQDEGSRETGPYQIVEYDGMAEKPYKAKA